MPGEVSGMPTLEGTLAIIKPDAFHRRIEIEEIILKEGFVLVDKKKMRFSKELASEFYQGLQFFLLHKYHCPS